MRSCVSGSPSLFVLVFCSTFYISFVKKFIGWAVYSYYWILLAAAPSYVPPRATGRHIHDARSMPPRSTSNDEQRLI